MDDGPAPPGPRGDAGTAPPPKALSSGSRRTLRLLAFIVVPGLFIAALVVGLLRTDAPHAQQGTTAPSFNLALVGGGMLSSAQLKGNPVVINFWASWCVPCQEEAPTLQAIYKQYAAKGVRVVGVDYEDTDADAQAFMRQYGVTYPSIRDPQGSLATEFGIRGVPETFFIDRNFRFFSIGQGQQVGNRAGTKIIGPITPLEMKSQLNAMLAAQPSPEPSASPPTSPSPIPTPTG